MDSATVQKPVTENSNSGKATHVNEAKHESANDLGAESGMPMFIPQISRSLTTPPPVIQRICEDCEDELGDDSSQIQAKLVVGAADDEYEQEADQVADKVMRMPVSVPSKSLLKKKGEKIQKKPDAASPVAPSSLATKVTQSPGQGAALSDNIRSRIEPVLSSDLRGVRVHNDHSSNEAAKSINAKAFTHQNNIFLGPNQSTNDLALMAHEATHTVQQGAANHLRREGENDDQATRPPHVALAFSLSGIYLAPQAGSTLRSDISERRQYAEMFAAAIAGERYSVELGLGLHNHLDTHEYSLRGPNTEADEQPLIPVTISLEISIHALDWLSRQLRSSPEQTAAQALGIEQSRLDLLILGAEVDYVWGELNQPGMAQEMGVQFPSWYGINFFRQEMAHRRELLREHRELRLQGGRSDLVVFELGNLAMESADILSFTRIYEPLFGDPTFRSLWGMAELEEGATPDGPAESQTPNTLLAMAFISFARSQPGPMRSVVMGEEGDPDPRQLLWDRYVRYLGRAALTSSDIRDQILTEGYSDRNADPLPASLAAIPELAPPFFDLATDADHAFAMDVTFSDIYEALADAFGGFAYIFEIIRVEGDSLNNASEAASSGSGDVAGWGQVWETRMARQARYLEADLGTAAEAIIPAYEADESHIAETILRLQLQMGPIGIGITQMVSLNAAIRAIGEVIGTFFLMLTTPRYERRLVFPDDGLYVVRAICTPELKQESEFRRAPSIAWMPVWARSAETMAGMRAEADVAQMLAQELALAEVSADLAEKDQCDEEYDQLRQDHASLSVALYGTAAEILEQQRQQLRDRKAELQSSSDDSMTAAERTAAIAAIDSAIGRINERLEVRSSDRNTDGRLDRGERIIASFVSDTGQVTRPLLEAAELSASSSVFEYYVSDLTTENSGEATGTGASRADAIEDALENLFEHYNAYGRGQLSAFIPTRQSGSSGVFRSIRVDADFTALGLEAVENITAVISVAAMVAAPFTGGASLAILLPVGIVGSVPAGYRIADRASAGTLRMDMQTAMDLVDIVGSVASAGEAVSGGLRMFRTTRFLGFLGTGSDGLGIIAVNWQTIQQLQNLPPNLSAGERRLHIMRVLGSALQANGMAVGGQMLARAYSPRVDADTGARPDVDSSRVDFDVDEGSSVSRHDTTDPELPAPRVDPEMTAQLPSDLSGRVPVEIDESLSTAGNQTVHVTYALDRWGLVTDIRIRRAPGASMAEIDLHLSTVRRMQQFVGLSGWMRNLLGRLSATVGITSRAEAGSLLWEARLELMKLPEVVQARMEQMQQAIDQGRIADAEAIDADIAFLQRQLEGHQRTLDDAVQARGRGYVAAESDLRAIRQTLRERRGTGNPVLTSIPAGWTGDLEARWHGLDPAGEGLMWTLIETDAGVMLRELPTGASSRADVRTAMQQDMGRGVVDMESDVGGSSFEPTAEASVSTVFHDRVRQTPSEGPRGTWVGTRGDGLFIPSDPYVGDLLASHGLDGIVFRNGYPDFSPVVDPGYTLHDVPLTHSRDANYTTLYDMLGQQWGVTGAEARRVIESMGLTPHELEDRRTVQFIDSRLHAFFGHFGGVGEQRASGGHSSHSQSLE